MSARRDAAWFEGQLRKLIGLTEIEKRHALPSTLRKLADEIDRHVAAEQTDTPDGAA